MKLRTAMATTFASQNLVTGGSLLAGFAELMINTLRGRVTMVFITHRLPKGLKVDRVVRIGAAAPSASREAAA